MFIFLQRAGSQTTNSIGLTSWAMQTNLAFFCSIRVVTCFKPYLRTIGASVEGAASPLAVAWARLLILTSLSAFDSGWYATNNLKSSAAWFLSRVLLNWFRAGGTFKRCKRIFFWRWIRTYFGHLTNLVRSFFGKISPPILKFLGLDSKSGLVFLATFFTFY